MLKINILVLKFMNGTESSETIVSKSEKCKKKQYFTERCEGGPKINISGLLSNHLLAPAWFQYRYNALWKWFDN